MIIQTVVVIGAGVSGLQSARALLKRGLQVLVLEQQEGVGGVWTKHYPGFGIRVPHAFYEFAEFPWPAHILQEDAAFPSSQAVQAYIEAYAEHFGLAQHIRFRCQLLRLQAAPQGGWSVIYLDQGSGLFQVALCDYVVVATGIYSVPSVPVYKGMQHFKGLQLHARDFTDPSVTAGKRVVVVGSGRSAIDCASMVAASHAAASVTWLFRQAHWPIPPQLSPGLPMQRLIFSRLPELLLPPYYTAPASQQGMHRLLAPLKQRLWKWLQASIAEQFDLSGMGLLPAMSLEADLLYYGQVVDAEWNRVLQQQAAEGSSNDQQQQLQRSRTKSNASMSSSRSSRRQRDTGSSSSSKGRWWGKLCRRLALDRAGLSSSRRARSSGGSSRTSQQQQLLQQGCSFAAAEGPQPLQQQGLPDSSVQQQRPAGDGGSSGCAVLPLCGEVERFARDCLLLRSGGAIAADVVVYCTGYNKAYDYLDGGQGARLGIQKDGLALYRNILPPLVPGLAFVGCEASSYNNVLTSGVQAEWLAAVLVRQVALPGVEEMQEDVRHMTAWRRRVFPSHRNRAAAVQLYMSQYHAQLLQDMHLQPPRTALLLPLTSRDYSVAFRLPLAVLPDTVDSIAESEGGMESVAAAAEQARRAQRSFSAAQLASASAVAAAVMLGSSSSAAATAANMGGTAGWSPAQQQQQRRGSGSSSLGDCISPAAAQALNAVTAQAAEVAGPAAGSSCSNSTAAVWRQQLQQQQQMAGPHSPEQLSLLQLQQRLSRVPSSVSGSPAAAAAAGLVHETCDSSIATSVCARPGSCGLRWYDSPNAAPAAAVGYYQGQLLEGEEGEEEEGEPQVLALPTLPATSTSSSSSSSSRGSSTSGNGSSALRFKQHRFSSSDAAAAAAAADKVAAPTAGDQQRQQLLLQPVAAVVTGLICPPATPIAAASAVMHALPPNRSSRASLTTTLDLGDVVGWPGGAAAAAAGSRSLLAQNSLQGCGGNSSSCARAAAAASSVGGSHDDPSVPLPALRQVQAVQRWLDSLPDDDDDAGDDAEECGEELAGLGSASQAAVAVAATAAAGKHRHQQRRQHSWRSSQPYYQQQLSGAACNTAGCSSAAAAAAASAGCSRVCFSPVASFVADVLGGNGPVPPDKRRLSEGQNSHRYSQQQLDAAVAEWRQQQRQQQRQILQVQQQVQAVRDEQMLQRQQWMKSGAAATATSTSSFPLHGGGELRNSSSSSGLHRRYSNAEAAAAAPGTWQQLSSPAAAAAACRRECRSAFSSPAVAAGLLDAAAMAAVAATSASRSPAAAAAVLGSCTASPSTVLACGGSRPGSIALSPAVAAAADCGAVGRTACTPCTVCGAGRVMSSSSPGGTTAALPALPMHSSCATASGSAAGDSTDGAGSGSKLLVGGQCRSSSVGGTTSSMSGTGLLAQGQQRYTSSIGGSSSSRPLTRLRKSSTATAAELIIFLAQGVGLDRSGCEAAAAPAAPAPVAAAGCAGTSTVLTTAPKAASTAGSRSVRSLVRHLSLPLPSGKMPVSPAAAGAGSSSAGVSSSSVSRGRQQAGSNTATSVAQQQAADGSSSSCWDQQQQHQASKEGHYEYSLHRHQHQHHEQHEHHPLASLKSMLHQIRETTEALEQQQLQAALVADLASKQQAAIAAMMVSTAAAATHAGTAATGAVLAPTVTVTATSAAAQHNRRRTAGDSNGGAAAAAHGNSSCALYLEHQQQHATTAPVAGAVVQQASFTPQQQQQQRFLQQQQQLLGAAPAPVEVSSQRLTAALLAEAAAAEALRNDCYATSAALNQSVQSPKYPGSSATPPPEAAAVAGCHTSLDTGPTQDSCRRHVSNGGVVTPGGNSCDQGSGLKPAVLARSQTLSPSHLGSGAFGSGSGWGGARWQDWLRQQHQLVTDQPGLQERQAEQQLCQLQSDLGAVGAAAAASLGPRVQHSAVQSRATGAAALGQDAPAASAPAPTAAAEQLQSSTDRTTAAPAAAGAAGCASPAAAEARDSVASSSRTRGLVLERLGSRAAAMKQLHVLQRHPEAVGELVQSLKAWQAGPEAAAAAKMAARFSNDV